LEGSIGTVLKALINADEFSAATMTAVKGNHKDFKNSSSIIEFMPGGSR
jgi:hypothetical protein